MNLAKRVEALEAAAVKAKGPESIDVIRVIIEPGGRVVGAYRRNSGGTLVPLLDTEDSHLV